MKYLKNQIQKRAKASHEYEMAQLTQRGNTMKTIAVIISLLAILASPACAEDARVVHHPGLLESLGSIIVTIVNVPVRILVGSNEAVPAREEQLVSVREVVVERPVVIQPAILPPLPPVQNGLACDGYGNCAATSTILIGGGYGHRHHHRW